MDVRMPDGTVVTNVPDGTSQSDLLVKYNATKNDPGALGALAIGAGRFVDQTAAGLRDLVPAPIRNGLDALNNKLGMGNIPRSDDEGANKAYAALQSQHPMATMAGEMLPSAPLGLPTMTAVAALQPGSAGERVARAATTYGLGKAGEFAAGKLADAMASKTAAPVVSGPLNDAVQAGYKIAPNEAGQQSALQWLGGQIKTQQTMASKNVGNTTRLAAQEVGLPEGPITRADLQGVRDQAGAAYDAVKNAGTVTSDAPMQAAAQGIENTYSKLTQSFKSLKSPEIETLIADMKNPAFDSEGLVEAVKRFRSDGFSNIGSQDPAKKALGRVQLQAQDALEGLIDRNLTAAGQPGAVQALQQARQLIAKTYSVQNALDANGNVVASKLSSQLAKGKPLSGNLETIAKTAAAFPKSLQNYAGTPPAFSALDGLAAIAGGAGKEALLLGARPIARAAIASGPYQNAFMGGGLSRATTGLLNGIGNSGALEDAGGLLGLLGQLVSLPGSQR